MEEEEEGESIYLLLSKEHRVSRSVRASWLIRHLCKDIKLQVSIYDDKKLKLYFVN